MQGNTLIKEGIIESILTRKNKNLSWLARQAEIDSSYLTLLLKRERHPSARVRENIMSALEVDDWDTIFEAIE